LSVAVCRIVSLLVLPSLIAIVRRGSGRLVRERAPARPRPGRDAGTGRAAGRLAVGRIAHGMSNSEISDTLAIAAETTKTHVKRILVKLGLRDRAQAVVVAYESGLVTPRG
jgi:hypothetical protein